jgi:hypothetical protein
LRISVSRIAIVVPGNSDLIDKVEIDLFSSILACGRIVGVVCVRNVCFSNSSGIAA